MIDDDEKLAPPLSEYFARFDLSLTAATTPAQGLLLLDTEQFELVILDVMLPEKDGFEVCREIRKSKDIPIIMLTARGEVTDRVVGLELGADDYLPKPFEPRELVARIQNIRRRLSSPRHDAEPESKNQSMLKYEDLTIDLQQRTVTVKNKEIELTSMEYQLLTLLATSPGRDFSRDEILNALKGTDTELFSRSVDIMVSRLRNKLKPAEPIKTVWGSGYAFTGRAE